MKPLTRDISLTLLIKLLLLFLLWWFCVKGKHFVLSNPTEWLLGNSEQPVQSQTLSNPKKDSFSTR